jgi:hypothetical protein
MEGDIMSGLGAGEPNDDPSHLPTGPEFARYLVGRALGDQTPAPNQLAVALEAACAPVFSNVRASMGDDGCRALFGRAFVGQDETHPALRTIRGRDDCEIPLERILASIAAHGADATRAAVEALLAELVDILARLIGADMTIRILDPEAYRSETRGGEPSP